MTSIKEVAEAAGVSTATVSRVLSNKPHVRPELREKVLEAVENLGYRPNLVARTLRSQRSNAIGLIVSDIRNPYFTAISRAVEDIAYDQGYQVIFCNSDEDPDKEASYLRLMRDQNIAGIIFSPTRKVSENIASVSVHSPMVIVDRTVQANGFEVDVVRIDNVDAGYRLTKHLINNGYCRIMGLFGEASTTGRERRAGFEKALQESDLPIAGSYMPPRIESGYAAAKAVLVSENPPDAILTTNSLLMAGVLQAIRELNLQIPEQVGLAGFDRTTWTDLMQPPITLIEQPTTEIGRCAAELLLQRIEDPQRPTREIILQGKLVIGGSSAPRGRMQALS
jgi:LacI family fructose operon transcriptional repressor